MASILRTDEINNVTVIVIVQLILNVTGIRDSVKSEIVNVLEDALRLMASTAVTLLSKVMTHIGLSSGHPEPQVSWWRDGVLLDDSSEVLAGRRIRNVLRLDGVRREDLGGRLTCQATNSPQLTPLTATLSIDIYRKKCFYNIHECEFILWNPNKIIKSK